MSGTGWRWETRWPLGAQLAAWKLIEQSVPLIQLHRLYPIPVDQLPPLLLTTRVSVPIQSSSIYRLSTTFFLVFVSLALY